METCYYCGRAGSEENPLNFDHVPPECFFKGFNVPNLIKVRACEKRCNGDFSQLDNDMRALLASGYAPSPAGSTIRDKKVIPKLKTKDVNLHKRLGLNKALTVIPTRHGGRVYPSILVDRGPVKRWFKRITKGLLRYYYPAYDSADDLFRVTNIRTIDNPAATSVINSLKAMLTKDSRGHGIFEVWHGPTLNMPGRIWIYVFFGCSCFMVLHGPPVCFAETQIGDDTIAD